MENNAVPPRLFDLRRAAAYLGEGVSIWSIRNLVWDGQLPTVKLGRKLYITRDDLDSLISRLRRFEGTETRGKSGARPA